MRSDAEMRILAIVVTYFPEKEMLKNDIEAFVNDVDKVLIWENTPDAKRKEYRFVNHPKAEYCGDGVNSISHALNYAWHYAMANGYDFLLTMDQDSVFVNFKQYVESTVLNKQSPIGIWTPSFAEINAQIPSEKDKFSEIIDGITSGMLQSISVITRIGGWNESFTIDCVDTDYCLHARRVGVVTYRVGGAFLVHRLGNPKAVSFLVWKPTILNYSAGRYYSIYRNFVLLTRMYKEQTDYKPLSFWYSRIKWIACLEEHGLKKLVYILAGIVSGKLCKLPQR